MGTSPDNEFAVFVDGWFDGERHHRGTPGTFLVKDGRIGDIAAGDHSADLARRGISVQRGGFLMPGLVDAHVHLFLDGAPTDAKLRSEHFKQPVEHLTEAARISARQNLACGVTVVRDAGRRPPRHQQPGARRGHGSCQRSAAGPFRRLGRQAPEALRRLHGPSWTGQPWR